MPAMRRLILTRVASAADAPAEAMPSSVWQRVHWPLIAIEPVTDATTVQHLQQAWRDWSQWQAVMFVSAAAALHFFSHRQSATIGQTARPGAPDRGRPRPCRNWVYRLHASFTPRPVTRNGIPKRCGKGWNPNCCLACPCCASGGANT